jgi:hypothetical protein
VRDEVPLFYPVVFAKTLTATLCVAVVGCALALRIYGELAVRDIVGTAISSLLFAYLVHLWIALGRREAA